MGQLLQKLSLQQVLSPQQILSLKLLQLPTLELEQVVKQELESNPLLESEEEDGDGGEEKDPSDDVDWDAILEDGFRLMGAQEEREEVEEDRRPQYSARTTLWDHLRSQLHLLLSDRRDIEIGEAIIGNLDEDGYLCCSVGEIAESSGFPEEDVERVLRVVQGMDPPGVGARDLRECMMIQLREMDLEDSLAMRIVRDHLDDLVERKYRKLCEELGVTEGELKEAEEVISKLNPRPASANFGEGAMSIVPDLIVERRDGDYEVVVNDSSVPSLRISPLYRSLLREESLEEEVRRLRVLALGGLREVGVGGR